MKALSLWQPWAQFIVLGHKRVETRSWPTRYRGDILIHATKSFPHEARDAADGSLEYLGGLKPDDLPRGVLVAFARLVDCVETGRFYETQRDLWAREEKFGNYMRGRFAWVLEDVVPIWVPVPAKGAQGLWEWPPPPTPDNPQRLLDL